ncbi:ribosomal protein S18 acetylase RimI-like enzyme [Algoriphagus sp. 4150]|uniref:GNAT family N-acetyltransferase n=1 Tax=Algoriphagus sp. 4150 TaxID=2817756 RepID=UPI002863C37F|nr:GNAT family N-acetyltransferase [Algoriphagus sp. 4150]MDR7132571.1 ribosomal protein S18 acetylase RimI-like enzyme [Algoriphagus sp. 4150]
MIHPLDNPIWTALSTNSAHFASGDQDCLLLDRDMGFFAGMPEYGERHMKCLYDRLGEDKNAILFTPGQLYLDKHWKVFTDRELLQMVWDGEPAYSPSENIRKLSPGQVNDMMALTAITRPGPFLEKTILFGGYLGIYEQNQLVAMAGYRLQPGHYTELSAVCTHPNYTGRGYSHRLLTALVKKLISSGKTPFLHVYPDNLPAVKLYRKLGFRPRKSIRVYNIAP